MSVPSPQEKTREELIELWSFWQNETIKEQIKNRRLEEENNKLWEKYKLLRDNSYSIPYVKRLLNISSCLIAAGLCGFGVISNGSALSIVWAITFFVCSFLLSILFKMVLLFLCEITDRKFLNEKVEPYAPYLIIPFVYLFIVINFS